MIFKEIEEKIKRLGLKIASKDFTRPWGGFFVISESETLKFVNHFFEGIDKGLIEKGGRLSPKILIVNPNSRLSWQYHLRRSEVWQVIRGRAGVVRSDSDVQKQMKVFNEGDKLTLRQGERHRLIGLEEHCVIAEIWQHTDIAHPSDENDIIRVQDDFGR